MSGRGVGKSAAQAYGRLWQDLFSNIKVSDIKLECGTVYGSRYYTAEPVGGNWFDMEAWCHKTFGPISGSIWAEDTAPKPAQRWYMNNRKFWFRDEADRLMFVMRWR